MVLPALFFLALGGSVWGVCVSLWDLAGGDTDSVLTNAITARLDSPSQADPGSSEKPLSSDGAADPDEPDAAREWRLRGVVYDLTTLKPLPGCAMTFTDDVAHSQERHVTDVRGRYRITLPALADRGYQLTVEKPGYAKSELGPLQPDDERPLVTDFHLAPVR